MKPMVEWIKGILRKLYLLDRPVAKRSRKDRRRSVISILIIVIMSVIVIGILSAVVR